MKRNSMLLLLFVVAMCKAAKFPIHLSHQDEPINEEIVPVTVGSANEAADCDFCTDYMLEDCYREDVTYCKSHSCYVPVKCNAKKAADCDFCTDYMLEDCYHEDVTYCKSHSCYVPEKCNAKKDEPINEEIVPVTVGSANEVAADCDFCTDYMLEDCYHEDVTYCKSHSCYVPEKCNAKKDEPINDEIIPVTVGSAIEDCDFCTDYMLKDCYREDVTHCKSHSCYVPEKCNAKKGGVTEEGEAETTTKQPPVTEEIVPVTAQAVGPILSRVECQYCELMYWGCICDDVNYCLNRWNCPVKPLCLKKCLTTTTKQPPATTAMATTKRPGAYRCGNCAYMIWGCDCATVIYCLQKQCTVKPQCLTQCGVTEGGEVKTTKKQPMTVPVTTGGTKSPVASATTKRPGAGPTTTKQPPATTAMATTKRPGANPCGNCAYMIWGCNCATANYCLKKQCIVKPQCLAQCKIM